MHKLTLYLVGRVLEIDLPEGTDIQQIHQEVEDRCIGYGSIFYIAGHGVVALHIDAWKIESVDDQGKIGPIISKVVAS